jgi:TfoX/Sxy family transcriptional regulator of competence genes
MAMASKQSSVDYIVGQLGGAGTISALEMFGELAICCDGKMVALLCDDRLFVKRTVAARMFIRRVAEASPYETRLEYMLVPAEKLADADWLTQLLKLSCAELPTATKKRRANSRAV